jgi:hypothetical protein
MENLNLNSQNFLTIQGAKKILSCTQSQALIETENKKIILSGNSIEVKKLNLENCEVCLYGLFTNIKFCDETEKKGLLKRIFK